MDGKGRHDSVDRAIARIAEAQHGVISSAQLSELAVGRGAVEHRIREERLRPLHRGVYAIVGPRLLSRYGRWMAAVLACGPGAVLSHLAAAALWGIRRGTRIEVTQPRGRKRRPGIRVHWADLPADEATVHHGIPVTTIGRTLLDLSAVVQRDELRSAFRRAEQQSLADPIGIPSLLERYPRKPGIPILKAVFQEAQSGLTIIRSELEERFQAFVINAGLPSPATNVRIEEMEVDCAWPKERLIVELDGRGYHDSNEAFGADRARDRRLEAAGWRVVRITWAQLARTAGDVERDLRRLLEPVPASRA
jgi:hypothetical protein